MDNHRWLEKAIAGSAAIVALLFFIGYLSASLRLYKYGYSSSLFMFFSYHDIVWIGAIAVLNEAIQQIPTISLVVLLHYKLPTKFHRPLASALALFLTFAVSFYFNSHVYVKQLIVDWLWGNAPYANGVLLGVAVYTGICVSRKHILENLSKVGRAVLVGLMILTLAPIMSYKPTGMPGMTPAKVVFVDGYEESLRFVAEKDGMFLFAAPVKQTLTVVPMSQIRAVRLLNTGEKHARISFWLRANDIW